MQGEMFTLERNALQAVNITVDAPAKRVCVTQQTLSYHLGTVREVRLLQVTM